MDDTRIEVDLVRMSAVLENDLRLVAFLGREDAVCLGGGNAERVLEAGEFVFLDK